jgi:hypothetical protein
VWSVTAIWIWGWSRVYYLKMLSMPRWYSIRDECGAMTKRNQQVYKQSVQSSTCPSATLSTTNPTWTDVRLKLDLCSAMPATNCLSCCTDRGGTIIWDMYRYMALTSGRIIRIPCSCRSQWIYKQFNYFVGRTNHSSQIPYMHGISCLQQRGISSKIHGIFPQTTHLV